MSSTVLETSQFSSAAQLCPTLCNPMDCSPPSFPVHLQLPELAQTHVHELMMPSNHLIFCRPFLLPPSNFASIRVFSNGSVLHIRWPKYWSFSFRISSSKEYSGLISFRIDWFDFLGLSRVLSNTTVKSINSSALSFLYGPTLTSIHDHWKNHSFDIRTFVSKVMSLLFNMLSRLVIAFLPKEQASFNFMAAITICSDFGAPKNKVSHCFHCFPIYLP